MDLGCVAAGCLRCSATDGDHRAALGRAHGGSQEAPLMSLCQAGGHRPHLGACCVGLGSQHWKAKTRHKRFKGDRDSWVLSARSLHIMIAAK